jgi:hypothetical protein
MIENIDALKDALYREKVARARGMTALEKFQAGQVLFETGCLQMLGNIRGQMPNGSEDEWHNELQRRLSVGRRLDELQLRKSYRR